MNLTERSSLLIPHSSFARRGSALLIVLGMMSFMVVSAVAFSMFMRQNRLPSSFLRQRLTASQLVKAGLAGAMQRIDAAIGDNPYPGVGLAGTRSVEFETSDGRRQNVEYGNYWHNRVFLESKFAQDGIGAGEGAELAFRPVSTLTLEALAYLPPPLVNTVRYWASRTSTASWQSLGYDAGRYAFTAVNVSDYFDVNRIRANVMRDSSPANRISVGYLFEDGEHTGNGSVSPADFDAFVSRATNDVFKTRFVSLADYNLALCGANPPFASPFCQYIRSPASDGSFYGSAEEDAKRQKFVADSWFSAGIGGADGELYLTDEETQPLHNLDDGLDPLMKDAGRGFNEIKKHLNLAERAALVDYIDDDNVPTSLALPTMERAPMLTGLQVVPMTVSPPKVVKACDDKEDAPYTDKDGYECTLVHRAWSLDSLGEVKLLLGGSAVYPFKRKFATDKLGEPTTFDVQVLVKAFLSKESQALTGTRASGYRPTSKDEWKDQSPDMNTGLYTFFSKGSITVKPGVMENDAFCSWSSGEINLKLGNGDLKRLYGIKFLRKKAPANMGGAEIVDQKSVQPDDTLVKEKPLMLRDASGATHPATELTTGFENLKLNLMVWVRVMDGNDTVDLVPATIADDQVYNGVPLPGVSTDLLGEPTKEPVMPVDGPVIKLVQADFKPNADSVSADYGESKGLRAYCNDPRYNWAPEDWYAPSGDEVTISAQGWYDAVKGQFGKVAKSDRPRDLFQFVSNAGYLQSMGEIQFLPLVRREYSDFAENNAISSSFHQNNSRYGGQAFSERTGIGQLADKDYMWKTRFAFGDRASAAPGSVEADPYDWGVSDSNGGPAVSPYADEELMMAAIANTPYDYSVASADNRLTLADGRKYTFGPGGSEANVRWEELRKVAKGIKSTVGTSTDWEDKLFYTSGADDPWDADAGPFDANFGSSYHDVDRKFLYSYWRSCFANRQQLFLIFVRAEPTVMGGTCAGHTPSQLGARAVALVWREPVSSVGDETSAGGSSTQPHRMRILFYHQFE